MEIQRKDAAGMCLDTMIQLEIYGPPLVEYKGKGSIVFDEVTQIPVEFKCIQLHNADIYSHVNFIENTDFRLINGRSHVKSIQGYLDDGRSFKSIDGALLTEWTITVKGSTHAEGLLILSGIEIKLIENSHTKIAIKSKFYLTNLRFLGLENHWLSPTHGYRILPLEIRGQSITIIPGMNYDKLVKEMRATEACTVTSYLETPINNLSKEEILELVANLCSILSFAKGTEVTWAYYEEVDDVGTVITSIHRSSITSNFGSWELIPHNNPTDIKIFIEATYERYILLLNKYRLDRIFHTIVQSKLGGSFLELRALNMSSAIDVLRGRWAKLNGKTKITSTNKFKNCKKMLKTLINDFVRVGVCSNQIDKMLNKIPELNRPSLGDVLKEMVVDTRSEITTDQIETFIKTRNKLVHEGTFATGEEFKEFRNIIYLADHLIMALLDYRGPYIDCRSWKRVTRQSISKDDSIEDRIK
jgi:hypothetical protein